MVHKVYFDVMDFMVLNAYLSWNMSAPNVSGRFEVKGHELYAAMSEAKLTHADTGGEEAGTQVNLHDESKGHHTIGKSSQENGM